MHRTSRTALFLAVLVATVVAAAPAPAASRVGSDPCADPAAERDTGVTPWTDLCTLDVVATNDGDTDAVTTLEVRVGVASTERATASALVVSWDTDDCRHQLAFGDASMGAEAFSHAGSDCRDGAPGAGDCLSQVQTPGGQFVYVFCQGAYQRVDVAPPVVEDGAYVWRLTLDGELAEVLGAYAPGTELAQFRAAMSARANGSAPLGVLTLCADSGDPQTCYATGRDHLEGGGSVTVD